jgi:hypothetical protein
MALEEPTTWACGAGAGGRAPSTPALVAGARGAWNDHAWTIPVHGLVDGQKPGGGAGADGGPFFFFFLAPLVLL